MHSLHFVFLAAAVLLLTNSPTVAGMTKEQLEVFAPMARSCRFGPRLSELDAKISDLEQKLGSPPEPSSASQPASLEEHGYGHKGHERRYGPKGHEHGYEHKGHEHGYGHKHFLHLHRRKCHGSSCEEKGPAPPTYPPTAPPAPETPLTPEEEGAMDEKWLEALHAKGTNLTPEEQALKEALEARQHIITSNWGLMDDLLNGFKKYWKSDKQHMKKLRKAIEDCGGKPDNFLSKPEGKVKKLKVENPKKDPVPGKKNT